MLAIAFNEKECYPSKEFIISLSQVTMGYGVGQFISLNARRGMSFSTFIYNERSC